MTEENNPESTEPSKLGALDKHPDDLTVKEALKINLGIAAVFTAGSALIFAAPHAIDAVQAKFRNRRLRKLNKEQDVLLEEEDNL